MRKLPFLFLSFALLMLTSSVFSQKVKDYRNADGYLISKKVVEDPSLVSKYETYEAQMKQLISQIKENPLVKGTMTDTLINGKRVIPVVFHIIHTYGNENISNAQVYDAIEKMNIDYQKLNADTADTYGPYKSRAADCQLEFRLAKIDPNGNCTSGIERVYDTRTDYAYYTVMHDYCWTPSHYLNIFAVDFIYPEGIVLPDGAFIGGMSPFPPSNSLTQALTGGDTLIDGVLIRQDCIGSIGTATDMGGMGINALNRTLTHEAGHYWNLYHPFQSMYAALGITGCENFLFGTGDEVDDTPWEGSAAQNTSLSCFVPGTRNSCTNDSPDEFDMVENYMDYQWGYCSNIFTSGQKDRIDATLASDRAKLWSYENLVATGVLDTNDILCAPIADFNQNYKMICPGSTVTFTDFSYNGAADSWLWTFPGGTPSTSTSQNPTITYNTPGTYSVTLKAINASGSDSITKQNLILVSDPTAAQDAPYTEGFETNINSWLVYNVDGNPWATTDSASFSGSKSLWVSNFSNNYANTMDEIITPALDFTAITPTPTLLQLKFQVAYAGKTVTNTLLGTTDTIWDNLRILVSTDCGKTWTQRYTKTGSTLATAPLTASRFFPASTAEWRQETVNLNPYITGDNVRFKFQFNSKAGNNLFIDDINITVPTGIEEQAEEINLNIFPNPLNESTVVSFNLTEKENVKVEVLDILGKQISLVSNDVMTPGVQKITIEKNMFGSAGFYFVKLTIGDQSLMKKVIVQ